MMRWLTSSSETLHSRPDGHCQNRVRNAACTTPPNTEQPGLLRPCHQASLYGVKAIIEREKLYGLGCGLVDMALLASALMTPGAKVWTQDLRLANLAGRFGVAHCPTL